jgi:hypothetical protein
MLHYLRSALAPVLCLLIGIGGVSYGLTANTLGLSPASTEGELPDDGIVPDEEPPAEEPPAEEPPAEDPPAEEPPVEEPPVVEGPEVEQPDTEEPTTAESSTAKWSAAKWSTEGCPEGFTGNHGQYVSSTEDRPRNGAARSTCGKPMKGGNDDSEDTSSD